VTLTRRTLVGCSSVLATALVAAGVLTAASPVARTALRNSFTRLPDEYTELYFAGTPSTTRRNGRRIVQVPIALLHHGTSARTYAVKVSVVDTPMVTETDVRAEPGRVTPRSFSLPANGAKPAGHLVEVTIAGSKLSLHYRLKPPDSK